jgi:hypothetical protein
MRTLSLSLCCTLAGLFLAQRLLGKENVMWRAFWPCRMGSLPQHLPVCPQVSCFVPHGNWTVLTNLYVPHIGSLRPSTSCYKSDLAYTSRLIGHRVPCASQTSQGGMSSELTSSKEVIYDRLQSTIFCPNQCPATRPALASRASLLKEAAARI